MNTTADATSSANRESFSSDNHKSFYQWDGDLGAGTWLLIIIAIVILVLGIVAAVTGGANPISDAKSKNKKKVKKKFKKKWTKFVKASGLYTDIKLDNGRWWKTAEITSTPVSGETIPTASDYGTEGWRVVPNQTVTNGNYYTAGDGWQKAGWNGFGIGWTVHVAQKWSDQQFTKPRIATTTIKFYDDTDSLMKTDVCDWETGKVTSTIEKGYNWGKYR